MPNPSRTETSGHLRAYLFGRRNVPFATLRYGETFLLERGRLSELVAREDTSTAFTPYRLGFGMHADDAVSVRRAWLGRLAERPTYAARTLRLTR
jgi:hypothetical protein